MNISKVHQVCLAICGLLCTAAAIWSFVTDTFGANQVSVARIAMNAYLIALALVLLTTSAFGMKQPLKWFGLLESYIGSGLYVIFLAFFTLGLGNDFGLYSAIFMFVVGILSVILGLAGK